jgi:hypothetical protein
MAEDSVSTGGKGKPARLSRGFVRAGGLIAPQMQRAATRRGFAQARLRTLWPDIAGPELAAICVPVKLAPARGPAGGLLTLAVAGAHAPQLQMLLPLVRERVNAALGPRTVGRIQLTHGGFAEAPRAFARRPAAAPAPRSDLGPVAGELSSIGDAALRDALETLARNVLSRTRPTKRPE